MNINALITILLMINYSVFSIGQDQKLLFLIKKQIDFIAKEIPQKTIDISNLSDLTIKKMINDLGHNYKFVNYHNNENLWELEVKNENSYITLTKYATIDDIKEKGLDFYIEKVFFNIGDLLSANVSFMTKQVINTYINMIGDVYRSSNHRLRFLRGNLFVAINFFDDEYAKLQMYKVAKVLDKYICELNGIPYDPNFPEKEDNDSEEDKEVKRKIADGTYTKIEDLPKPQSQSDNVKNNVKNPQEEKTVTKIDSPISPKIENSKSKIFIILGILFTVVFGGFLLIYKKCKKKKIIKDKNTELNN